MGNVIVPNITRTPVSNGSNWSSVAGVSPSALFTDDFSSGDLTHTENGVSWGSVANAAVAAAPDDAGNNAAKFSFIGHPTNDAWGELRFDLGAQYDNVTIEFDMWIPSNYVHKDSNNKFFRLWPTDYGDAQKVGSSLWAASNLSSYAIDRNTGDGGMTPNSPRTAGFIISGDLGKWTAVKLEIVIPTAVADGLIKTTKNGEVFDTYVNPYDYAGGAGGYRYGYLLGWANSGFLADTDIYLDNVKFYGSN